MEEFPWRNATTDLAALEGVERFSKSKLADEIRGHEKPPLGDIGRASRLHLFGHSSHSVIGPQPDGIDVDPKRRFGYGSGQ